MLEGMMTAAEKMRTTEKKGLPIKILDRKGSEYNLTLRFVNTFPIMGADCMKLVDDNGTQTGHFLDLWVYRVGQRGSGDGIGNEASELRTHDEKAEEEEEHQ
ncbi:hypothetical protein GW17_00054408 [Ensete ventricosum]|nr:hypothetical protein GW17_00054408 [Ensete ventricosum]